MRKGGRREGRRENTLMAVGESTGRVEGGWLMILTTFLLFKIFQNKIGVGGWLG